MKHEIKRITFLVHPYAYAKSLWKPSATPPPHWEDYHTHELAVARRWVSTLDAMGDGDAVIYHPCYQSEEEKALAAYGEAKLARRFITLGMRPEIYTPEILSALAKDIAEAFRVRGKYSWYAHDLRVAAFSYSYAQDILSAFRERGISFDPSATSLRCMGESFEGCANNWSTMVPVYLGIPSRMEMPYELSVPDTHFLLPCRFEKRVEMPFDTALYLFVDPSGNPMALYVRERVCLADPSYYASLSIEYERIRIRIRNGSLVFSEGQKHPSTIPPSFVRKGSGGNAEVMVASGRWRGGEGPGFPGRESHLFVAPDELDPETFFSIAQSAEIVPIG
ncbi:MAG: hypothetical protein V1800_17650 [Candidatus Latescibacterota bacterium]